VFQSAQPITNICSQEYILLHRPPSTRGSSSMMQQQQHTAGSAFCKWTAAAAQVIIVHPPVSVHIIGRTQQHLAWPRNAAAGDQHTRIPVCRTRTSFSSCLAAVGLLCVGSRLAASRLLLCAGVRHSLSPSQLAAAAPSRSCRRSSSSCKQRVQHSAASEHCEV
jgi:hypothetical protein